jgi:ABC-type polysaccharide/polyol phosphate export permease
MLEEKQTKRWMPPRPCQQDDRPMHWRDSTWLAGVSTALFLIYRHWFVVLAAFLGYVLLAIGLGLLIGSFIKSMMQLGFWMLVIALFLMVPPLFYTSPNLKAGIRSVLTWAPTSALASLFRYGCSTGATLEQILPNLAIVSMCIALANGHLENTPF